MDLTVQQLRYFVAVAEELHFTRAAERLIIATPSLSQQVAALERRLGMPLFKRTSRHVELTPAGQALLPLARRAVGAMDDVIHWTTQAGDLAERVRVGMVGGTGLASAIIAEAARALPTVRWELRRLEFADSVASLRNDRADVVLAPSAIAPRTRGVRAVPLWTEEPVLCVHSTHPLAERASVCIGDIVDCEFAGRDAGNAGLPPGLIESWPADHAPRIVHTVRTFDEAMDVCSVGLGVFITGSAAASGNPRPDLTYVPVSDLPDLTMYLLHEDKTRTGAIPALERIAADLARREAHRFGARKVGRTRVGGGQSPRQPRPRLRGTRG
ncbi:LysR family transcriptional regulator [Nocardiopsis gilva YIM 90087]|uniref:LysR family transcriptional regulator n=1 Tax=Nocardiopsis gilva YIM 90087 TaxID=1235441 RepID=A0A223SCK7_9ACTN|nr:LysR family transcriptional regulator [Nocardiopsis gilva]ASU85813.1 LysR family transcriptional regulator [Nocardiopsis gilva YIM 90087]